MLICQIFSICIVFRSYLCILFRSVSIYLDSKKKSVLEGIGLFKKKLTLIIFNNLPPKYFFYFYIFFVQPSDKNKN